jgi:tRNA-modifying protein YgfZ
MIDESIDAVRAGYDALCGDGAAAIVTREVITVHGPDAGRYLQGQLSQDVVAMATPSAWSFILQPTGKVDAWMRVHRLADDEFRLEVEPGHGAALLARLRRFLLRTDATISEPETWTLLARRWSPSALRFDEQLPGALLGTPVGPGVAGVDALLAVGPDATASIAGEDLVSPAALERYRIAHGVPAMGAELTAETIPGEVGSWVIDASVSFTKGCYTGQELVARIDSRGGNVPRPIRCLTVLAGGVDGGVDPGGSGVGPAVGAEVRLDGTVVGTITSSCGSLGPDHPALALGQLARAVEIDAVVDLVDAHGAVRARVTEPPAAR